MQALVLAAGKGTRMRSSRPKVLHEILGRPILDHVLQVLTEVGIKQIKVVIGSGAEQVRSFLDKRKKEVGGSYSVILQLEQKGTGHAVEMARKSFSSYKGDLLIWPGDMPLLKRSTIEAFIKEHHEKQADASVLSALRIDPAGYGRILRAGGEFYAIREELDASVSERRIQEVNTGIYLFKTPRLYDALKKIKPSNAKQELYLTDTIEVLAKENAKIEAFPLALSEEGQGINSRIDQAEAIGKMQNREILTHQEQGVTFVSPEQTFVEKGVKIGQDTTIYPWCYIESGVEIGERCQIGPFAKIRKGTQIGNDSVIGSFVEVNRSKIGNKVLAKHLAYLGDAIVGDETNIGAGTITANFDGKNKHTSKIGKKVLVGSNTVLVAPVEIGDGARTGAGSVVTSGSKIKKGEVVVGVPAKPLKKSR
jgi:bifunctional UDP-N-acetylglucosamine pyrophosphorylase / glucosamine-1-phosphate N-acetyltransferase